MREGEEDQFPSVVNFVEVLFEKTMSLSRPTVLGIERAHRAGGKKPPEGAPPRSIGVKLASYRNKEDLIKKAWQVKGFNFKDSRIYVDNDYAPEIQRRRKEYATAKKVLKENNIRFQTPFPAKLKVFYREGIMTYNTAHEATTDMVKRGLSVEVVKVRDSFLDQIKQQTWQTSTKKKGGNSTPKLGFKERLQIFRHQDDNGQTASV